MTTVELERIARGVVPPVGTSGWRITALDARGGFAVVPVLFGRLDGTPVLRGSQADCSRFYDLLEGRASTPRPGRDFAEGASAGAPSRRHGRTEAPASDGASTPTVANQPSSAVPTARSGGGQMSLPLRGGGTA